MSSDPSALASAVEAFERMLPGWWWTVGECSQTAHASCGPDRGGRDADLLEIPEFDGGFHCDAPQPARVADSLLIVMRQGLEARHRARGNA